MASLLPIQLNYKLERKENKQRNNIFDLSKPYFLINAKIQRSNIITTFDYR